MSVPRLIIATATPGSSGGLAAAASLAVAAAIADEGAGRVLLVEFGAPERGRAPTLLASESARSLERELSDWPRDGLRASARGRVCWLSARAPVNGETTELLCGLTRGGASAELVVAHVEPGSWKDAVADPELPVAGGLVRADLPRDRSLAALAAIELRERGCRARIAPRAIGRVGARRALSGLDPGGAASARAVRWLRAFWVAGSQSGQALPLVVGAALALVLAALVLAAIGGAVSGKERLQRAADLAAISAVRSMRDDVDRYLAPRLEPDGTENPAHLSLGEYLDRARGAARIAAERNGADASRLRVSFPDQDASPPLTAATAIGDVRAKAQAAVPVGRVGSGTPAIATGGGYAGPLVYRQGKGMRPDVAAAFDRLASAAAADGISLIVNSAFRSDAEQAALFAANPDPMWVAPPGTSLHRCATELDIGPPAAYGWLAANAPQFGFTQRYSWEPWHFGFDGGPPPCSTEGEAVGPSTNGHGEAAATGSLQSFVPSQFRAPIVAAAAKWNVSAGVLAAQLMAESNFNPGAVSPVGAQGIAQFMPGTAASYGLSEPFDPEASIDAQAHLMSDLLAQFGSITLALAAYNAGPGAVAACSCVPSYPETQAYVARILGLLDGVGEVQVPELEVRLID